MSSRGGALVQLFLDEVIGEPDAIESQHRDGLCTAVAKGSGMGACHAGLRLLDASSSVMLAHADLRTSSSSAAQHVFVGGAHHFDGPIGAAHEAGLLLALHIRPAQHLGPRVRMVQA